MRVRAERCAIRCVCWQPDPPGAPTSAAAAATSAAGSASAGGGDLDLGRLRGFLTASQWGDLKIWDPDDPFSPVHDRYFTTKVLSNKSCDIW